MVPSLSSPPLSEAISEKDVNLALADPGVQESPTATAHAIPGSLQSTLPLPSPVSGTHGSGMNRPDTNSHSSTHILPTSRPTNLMATDPSAFAQSLPHASWTSPFSQSCDDIEVEGLGTYEHGGFYAVVLGETFSSRRYTVVHKLGHGGFATVWLVWDHTNREYVALKILRADQSESCEELEILQYLARLGVNLEENFICPLLDSFSFDGPNGHHLCLMFLWRVSLLTRGFFHHDQRPKKSGLRWPVNMAGSLPTRLLSFTLLASYMEVNTGCSGDKE